MSPLTLLSGRNSANQCLTKTSPQVKMIEAALIKENVSRIKYSKLHHSGGTWPLDGATT